MYKTHKEDATMNFKDYLRQNGYLFEDQNCNQKHHLKCRCKHLLLEEELKEYLLQYEHDFIMNHKPYLNAAHSKDVVEVILAYLEKFRYEIDELKADNDGIVMSIADMYANLSFGVVDRPWNHLLCSKEVTDKNGNTYDVLLPPKEMLNKIVKMIEVHIGNVRRICIERENNCIAYSFVLNISNINKYLDDSKKMNKGTNSNSCRVYFKFDIRANDKNWSDKKSSDRKLIAQKGQKRQKWTTNDMNNTKLVGLSIHPTDDYD